MAGEAPATTSQATASQVPSAATDTTDATDPTERQGALPIEQAPTAEALLAEWYQRYPDTFFKGHTRPLKVGIHQDLARREPWPEKLVRRALAGYVNLPRYLKAVRQGAERIDLEGRPEGTVDTQAAEHAQRKLERLQAERRQRDQAGAPGRRRGGKAGRTGKTDKTDRKGRRNHGTAVSRHAAPAGNEPAATGERTPDALASAKPEERMEAKLSALLAKHNGRGKRP
ncbi:ABC transporter substrate-binding protein [Billgrantia endophytica]|uniref:ABC transporter substrate-binding protein n=1 Tax=Billgrantia endophytica TaxID=2033802 RepID=A0A2N7TXW0_9GAMM|nr:ABC transporter substrate-binding protein [Halomonas endophytica]